MRGFTPTGTFASTCPKPLASIGLLTSQFGLPGRADAEQRGMLMMLTEPGDFPVPALATTNSLRVGARSAHTGETPTGIGFAAGAGTGSSWFVCELMTETVPSLWFRMNARLPSAVI